MRSVSNRLIVATALLLLLAGLLWFGGNLYLSGKAQRAEVLAAALLAPGHFSSSSIRRPCAGAGEGGKVALPK